jgi:NTP pyrophosphatase (non-canonical NTP hydrolase)
MLGIKQLAFKMYITHCELAQQKTAIISHHLQIKGNIMDNQTKEVMDILQEECAEVIQAVSKISRFGLDNLKPGKPKTNREHLEEEIGDLYAMIEILQELDVVSWTNIERAAEAKREKLKIWSNIFKTENI